jgi:hypothetical protein
MVGTNVTESKDYYDQFRLQFQPALYSTIRYEGHLYFGLQNYHSSSSSGLRGEQQTWRACDMWNWGSRACAPTQQATIHVPEACKSFAPMQDAFIVCWQRPVLVSPDTSIGRHSSVWFEDGYQYPKSEAGNFYPGSDHTVSKQRLKTVAGNIPNSKRVSKRLHLTQHMYVYFIAYTWTDTTCFGLLGPSSGNIICTRTYVVSDGITSYLLL